MAEGHGWTWLNLIPGFDDLSNGFIDALGMTFLYGKEVKTVSHVFLAGVVFIGASVMAVSAGKRLRDPERRVLPETSLNPRIIMEIILGATMGFMEDIMGKKNAERFLPLIGSLAVFILFSNMMGLVPGMLPPTDNLNTTVACAVVVFVMTHVVGFQTNGIGYLKHFTGPAYDMFTIPLDTKNVLTIILGILRMIGAFVLGMLLVCIEAVSHIIRPVSLSLRLMGNMVGDHTVLVLFLTLVPLIVPLPFYCLGILVSVVQTLVFCLLSIVYIALAMEHGEEEGH